VAFEHHLSELVAFYLNNPKNDSTRYSRDNFAFSFDNYKAWTEYFLESHYTPDTKINWKGIDDNVALFKEKMQFNENIETEEVEFLNYLIENYFICLEVGIKSNPWQQLVYEIKKLISNKEIIFQFIAKMLFEELKNRGLQVR
jgi:hypothetical protein